MQNVLPGNLETYPGRETSSWRMTASLMRVAPLPMMRRTRSSTWDTDTVQTMQTLGVQRLSIPKEFNDNNGLGDSDEMKPQGVVKWSMLIEPPQACTRGEPTSLSWSMTDDLALGFHPTTVRIEVWNKAWTVPTVIAMSAPNSGHYLWKRVYWGMPIKDEYYIKIYGADDDNSNTLLAESPLFAIVK
ncbi:hypothetical protein DYB28_002925 [Aphanomyces astaci]|uniref:Uncharacterized protein n=1 Tax=Aphanomyces astaci TaxID=112090 RepID=A0A397DUD5_APHAT|nr:hypothetical protein AaE_009082 [Aphanomyces astaci]RHX97396.1 hypothetical protein DYB25_006953 [Aphanomyces astaci]RHY07784.1 hypothetical protein DYB36_011360 [Aphanomyces astaci]RHY65345.1 hypothetical protein DYB34_007753 [Aphanomyces astaci]RHY68484.1 hypothetical protein DYB30_006184 [Aphanomyces astaci]